MHIAKEGDRELYREKETEKDRGRENERERLREKELGREKERSTWFGEASMDHPLGEGLGLR